MTFRTGAAIGIATITLAGCSTPSPPDAPGPGGDASPQNSSDFSYNPPDGLKQQDKQKNGSTVFLGPTEGGFRTNLFVKSGQSRSIQAKQFGMDTAAKEVKDLQATILEQEVFRVPGSDAYTWLIARQLGGKKIEQRQFVIAKNSVVVLFTLTTAESAMKKWDQALADSLQTFKWGR